MMQSFSRRLRCCRPVTPLFLGVALFVQTHGASTLAAPPLIAKFTTDRGKIEATLDLAHAPVTVANFVALARRGYYDGLSFHKLIRGLLIESGDPTGSGAGGPGYCLPLERHPQATHAKAGRLAMASVGKWSHGSRFYITVAAAPILDPDHAVFGEITSGLEVAESLAATVQTNGKPEVPVRLLKVEIAGIAPPQQADSQVLEADAKTLETMLNDPVRQAFNGLTGAFAFGRFGSMKVVAAHSRCDESRADIDISTDGGKTVRAVVQGQVKAGKMRVVRFQMARDDAG